MLRVPETAGGIGWISFRSTGSVLELFYLGDNIVHSSHRSRPKFLQVKKDWSEFLQDHVECVKIPLGNPRRVRNFTWSGQDW